MGNCETIFSCDAFAHIPKDEREKHNSKSKKCIFVRYGEQPKGYRLYDPEKKRMPTAVMFNSMKMKDQNQPMKNTDGDIGSLIELDIVWQCLQMNLNIMALSSAA